MSVREIRLSGSGGQGLVLAGIIFAEAAILDGKNAVQTQSYGPEARGGSSKAEVLISDSEIYFPKVEIPEFLLILTQESADKYGKDIAEGGTVFYDSTLNLERVEGVKYISAPINSIARDELGVAMVANMISLGMICEETKLVSFESLEKIVISRVPYGTRGINVEALNKGRSIICS